MRAKDLRTIAESIRDIEARGVMLRIAHDYEWLAKKAEEDAVEGSCMAGIRADAEGVSAEFFKY
jgi:hypothetical protein